MGEGAKHSDVAVVGAGVIGLSIAHSLAVAGLDDVVVFDRSGIAAGASGVQPGGVRHQWSTQLNCRLVLESSAFYRRLGDELGVADPPILDPCGYLFLAHEEATLDRLSRDVGMQNQLGINSKIYAADDLIDIVPELRVDGLRGGAFCAEDGYFDRPQSVVEAFASSVRRAGGAIVIGDVRSVTPNGASWELTLTDGTRASAEHVVIAVGSKTPALVSALGVDLPITSSPKHLFFSEPIGEQLLRPLVIAIDRHFAAKHLANGRVLTSDLAASGVGDEDEARWRQHVQSCVADLLPRLTYVGLGLRVEGEYDVTPDHHPIVGPVDGHGRLWVAAGFSGHGFMIAPAIGRIVAQAVAGGAHDPTLNALSLERFDRQQLEPELQIV